MQWLIAHVLDPPHRSATRACAANDDEFRSRVADVTDRRFDFRPSFSPFKRDTNLTPYQAHLVYSRHGSSEAPQASPISEFAHAAGRSRVAHRRGPSVGTRHHDRSIRHTDDCPCPSSSTGALCSSWVQLLLPCASSSCSISRSALSVRTRSEVTLASKQEQAARALSFDETDPREGRASRSVLAEIDCSCSCSSSVRSIAPCSLCPALVRTLALCSS